MLRPRSTRGAGAQDVAGLVAAAQAGDAGARERTIAAHTSLVLRVGARVCGRYLRMGRDDEVSVGLVALNEAIDRFCPDSGSSFASFAEVVVRRRLIDFFRREAGRKETPFVEFEQEDEGGGTWSPVEFARAQQIERDRQDTADRQTEIAEFVRLLRPYGVSLSDLVRSSPQHADARQRAVAVARRIAAHPEWSAYLRQKHALPLRAMEGSAELEVSRKTLERQRKFIIAVSVILMEGLDMLRSYLPGA